MKIRHDAIDIGFTVIASPDDYKVSYTIYEILGNYHDNGALVYTKIGSNSFDPVTKLEEAEIFAHGEVKWDGCSNWAFDKQDRAMLHGCSRQDLENISKVLTFCWDLTAKLCPNWNGF